MKPKRYKRKFDHVFFLICLVGGLPDGGSNQRVFFLGFLLEPCRIPLAGQTWIQNFSQPLRYQGTCNKKLSQNTEIPTTENQRFQFWRLSVNYNWSTNALNIKIKDFNQGGWPQIMPSSAKPGQAQPEAVRFSQLKKKNFWGFSPLVLTIKRPLQIY